jgi:hypothetical protein
MVVLADLGSKESKEEEPVAAMLCDCNRQEAVAARAATPWMSVQMTLAKCIPL